MKLVTTAIFTVLSFSFVQGMGCKSKDTPQQVTPKVLPESTKASAPVVVPENTPVKLIENTEEENRKVDEKLNETSLKEDPVPTPPQKADSQKNKKKAKIQKNTSPKVKKAKKQTNSKKKA